MSDTVIVQPPDTNGAKSIQMRLLDALVQAGAIGVICFYVLWALGSKMDALTASVQSLDGTVKVLVEQNRGK